MSDLVERVAKRRHERKSMWPWDSVQDKQAKLTEARADIAEVLDAMGDVSEGMIVEAVENVGPIGCCTHNPATAAETWQAMLAQFKAENLDRPR